MQIPGPHAERVRLGVKRRNCWKLKAKTASAVLAEAAIQFQAGQGERT